MFDFAARESTRGFIMRLKLLPMFLVAVAVTLLLAGTSFAGITTYSGFDNGASARPLANSDAAAAAFDAATGNLPIITFESAPLGSFSSLVVAPGVTLTGAGYYGKGHQ